MLDAKAHSVFCFLRVRDKLAEVILFVASNIHGVSHCGRIACRLLDNLRRFQIIFLENN